jgi:hypothetical protein
MPARKGDTKLASPITLTTLQLTLTVEYELNGENEATLVENLKYIGDHAAGNGLMTGDGPAEVERWVATVTRV